MMKLFNPEMPVDIVYTWVDGNSESYRSLYKRYAKKNEDLNPERYRDVYTMLRYSLRSIEKYIPWYRNIYIITQRPQVPDWLKLPHPQVKVIHHDEIFDSEYLPTFNSNVIESYIHWIPDLSDYFLYLNDDFLFGRETFKGDFITNEGKINIFGTLFGERLKFRVYDTRWNIFSYGFVEHTPLFICKKAWELMLSEQKEEVHKTRLNRFRTDYDLAMDKLYRYYMLSKMRNYSRAVPALEVLKYHRFHKITNGVTGQKKGIDRLKKMRPKFYCLNDDQRQNPNETVVRLVKNFLDENYPEPSSFELNSERIPRCLRRG